MFFYLLRRVAMMIPLLLGIGSATCRESQQVSVVAVAFKTQLNPEAISELQERLRAYYDLDKPLYVQYGKWLGRLARLDFGESFSQDHRPVLDKIAERLPVTVFINVLSILVILGVAIPIGILSAVHQDSPFDRTTTVFVFLGFATPSFWLALLLMDLFGVRLGLLPIAGLKSFGYEYLSAGGKILDLLRHLVLPVFISAFGGLAGFSRYMRSNMLEVVRQDYILTARAKGLAERTVILKHALRNALLPIITILGLSVPGLIGGSVIFETIFAIPGMGKLFYDGVMMRDYPLIMGILVIGAVLTLIGNLLADIGYALADPRIRKS